jgi:hypothetical protein
MSFITPTGWIHESGFPQIKNGGDGGVSLIDRFTVPYDLLEIFDAIPTPGSFYNSDTTISELKELRLSDYTITPLPNRVNGKVDLIYQPSDSQIEPAEAETQVFLDNSTLEKTIESHPDFKTHWKYDLYGYVNKGDTPTIPTWALTATDRTDASNEEEVGEYMWTQDIPSGKKSDDGPRWVKIGTAIKQGVENYIIASPVVQERTHYKSKKSADEAAAAVGKKQLPPELFGKVGGEWLVMSASVQREGRRYLVEKSYQYADSWDGDVYENA